MTNPSAAAKPRYTSATERLRGRRTRWSARTIDGGASAFAVGGDLLLATGGKTGLTAYGLDGQRRFRLFDGKQAWVDRVYDGRAYVGIAGETAPERLRVVDLGSGRAVGERTLPLPWLLLDSSSGWWSSP